MNAWHERRVAVTGMGAICCLGKTVGEFWSALVAGECGLRPHERDDWKSLPFTRVGAISGYRTEDYFEPREARQYDPFAQYALIAAREAVADSGIHWDGVPRARAAVVTGTGGGGLTTFDEIEEQIWRHDKTRVSVFTVPRVMPCASSAAISMEFGLAGPAYTLTSACASATHAIAQAFSMLRAGMIDVAIAGGSEAPLSFATLTAWGSLRSVVTKDVCRPFSRDRSGMTLSEGGGMLVLESLEAALVRGAKIYGEIVGRGVSADATHITNPAVVGAERSMRWALSDGRVRPEAVGYINAHGTGTLLNDQTESVAIREVFGVHTTDIPVSSTKGAHGHPLGAAGALEAIATIKALETGVLPPNINHNEIDPDCPISLIRGEARETTTEFAISNSFAFGGLNGTLAFRKWTGRRNGD